MQRTYVVALVTVAGDLALTAADVDTGVDVGLAPRWLERRVHRASWNRAARNGRVEVASRVLRRGEASKGRSRNHDGGVEHGGRVCREYRCLSKWLCEREIGDGEWEVEGAASKGLVGLFVGARGQGSGGKGRPDIDARAGGLTDAEAMLEWTVPMVNQCC
jgi:hypothetical protein